MEIEFKVSYDAVPKINDLIAMLNKKYGKSGISVKENKIDRTGLSGDGITTLTHYTLKLDIEFPKIQHDGYTYIGTLQKVALDNNEYEIQAFGNLPIEYRTVEFRCDHCNSNRNRLSVNIFKNENNELKIIGTSCSKEYFGENVYSQICKFLGFSMDNLMSDVDDFCGGYSDKPIVDKQRVINYAYGLIKLSGKYISKTKSEDSFLYSNNPVCSTASLVEYYMSDLSMIDKRDLEDFKTKLQELNQFSLDINKVVEFWNTLDSTDTFIYNTQIALKMLNPQIGLITYAVYKYMVEVEDFNKSKIDYTKSNYIGNVKDKITENVKVLKLIETEGFRGATTIIVKMITESGNALTWFATNYPDVEENKSYTITGTVKDHSEYKGIKQTILTRCKIK